MPSPRGSLKARALQLLAQREQSGVELRRKLTQHAAAMAKADREGGHGGASARTSEKDVGDSVAARVDEVLDWLRCSGLSSDERFAESRVNARWSRFGNLRIRDELSRHGVAPGGEWSQRLDDSELQRARRVWSTKFGAAAEDAAGQARQYRFLAGRGFSPDVVRRVIHQAMREAAASENEQTMAARRPG